MLKKVIITCAAAAGLFAANNGLNGLSVGLLGGTFGEENALVGVTLSKVFDDNTYVKGDLSSGKYTDIRAGYKFSEGFKVFVDYSKLKMKKVTKITEKQETNDNEQTQKIVTKTVTLNNFGLGTNIKFFGNNEINSNIEIVAGTDFVATGMDLVFNFNENMKAVTSYKRNIPFNDGYKCNDTIAANLIYKF
jgi:hypothetical protein